ncbi:flagellar assembly protein A [Geochorda subterranea]|uniref:Flagellar assembly protein A n=1 Tax=Geochorda subterranea TaxID=3109564 RepID=A0ABZ1BSN0_9FIRM|nr:flagellar assembly protein A [Limnochorda sp. LNt]WRP15789.1 flagellar assembly protein A [Limnochorda sp. LNt]
MHARSIVVVLRGGDRSVVVGCRGAARDLARTVGFDPADQVRIATAVSEVVRVAIQHADGASLTLRQVQLPGRRGLEVVVEDTGATFADLDRALPNGGSAAEPEPGLVAALRLMDEYEVQPLEPRGARVRVCKWLPVPHGAADQDVPGRVEVETVPPGRGAPEAGGPGLAAPPEGAGPPAGEDGALAVQRGRVILYAPSGSGRLPTLRPGPHVAVRVNGTPVQRLRVVRPGDRIEVELIHDEPAVDLRVEVSPDGLEAVLHVERRPGRRYALADRPPSADLTLTAVPVETLPPPPVSRETIMTALQAAGVVYGIDEAAVRAVQASDESGAVIVARGLPPVPSQDGRTEVHFEDAPYVLAAPPDEALRADPLELYRVSTVAPGALLATRHPPRAGHPGRKVTGEVIPVATPKDARLRIGPGVLSDEEHQRAYAARGGRPTFHRGVVAVLPLHTVYGDVSPETGHVVFDGDVLVIGDVGESMRVEAGGRLTVGGVVSGAEVRAEEGAAIGRGIVRSRVVVGGQAAAALELAAALRPVQRQVEQLVTAVRFFKQQASVTARVAALGDGPIVRALVERKFAGLPRLVEGLLGMASRAAQAGAEGWDELVSTLYRAVTGPPGREGVAVDDLARIARRLGELAESLGASQGQPADVFTRYIHNALVEASGTVRMPSGACHYARIRAGRGFVMESGVFRGDEIVVQAGRVVLDEVGSPTGSKVWIAIVETGEVVARLVHPGVTVSIGGRRHDFVAPARLVRVRPTDTGLEVGPG